MCQNNNALLITQTHAAQMLFASTRPLDTWKTRKRRSSRKGEERGKKMMEDKTFIKMFGRGVKMYEWKWRNKLGEMAARGWREGSRRVEKRGKKQNKWCDVTDWNATQPVTYLYNINYTAQCLWIMQEPYLTRVNNLAAAWPIVYITGSISAKYR